MEKFFHLKENGTSVSTEFMAGLTTFFAMSYIIIVNPQILSQTGMPWGGVFLATIIASIVGTLIMGLFANVPYALAPGMGLNAFFTYTVCFGLGFTWQETLCMVFLCGLINILITVTKVRQMIIRAIPDALQHAIGGGIGLFVAYVGLLNVDLITFTTKDAESAGKGLSTGATPGLATFNSPTLWLFLIGLLLVIVFTILKIKGGMLLAIAITTVIGIPMGLTTMNNSISIGDAFGQLPQTFGALFTGEGFGQAIVNSLQTTFSSLIVSLLVGVCAAYVLARRRFRFGLKKPMTYWVLLVRVLPPVAFTIPLYIMFNKLGVLNTKLPVALACVLINVPLIIWFLISFFQDLPEEVEESAKVDGATEWQLFVRNVLPLVAPGIAAVAMLSFMYAWNEYTYTVIFTRTPSNNTVPLALSLLNTEDNLTNFGRVAAGGVISVIPITLFVIFAQNYLISGLSSGAVKE